MKQEPFQPHPNLSKEINDNIAESELQGGVNIKDFHQYTVLCVRTRSRSYTLLRESTGEWYISGHPTYCPEPTRCYIHGSTWGGSMIKVGYIGRGMHLEFSTDKHPGAITTSTIEEITEVR